MVGERIDREGRMDKKEHGWIFYPSSIHPLMCLLKHGLFYQNNIFFRINYQNNAISKLFIKKLPEIKSSYHRITFYADSVILMRAGKTCGQLKVVLW